MKKNYLLSVLLLVFASGFSQMTDISRIVESERKSATAMMNVTVNPNTLNYDVTYHKLEFTVNPTVASASITGKVTTTYTALTNMSTVTFDLTKSGLIVSSVKKGATNLAFVHNTNNELVITLPAVQIAGTSATVEINYSGQPSQEEGSFVRSTHNGQPIIWTLSEPFGARDWWPCKQDLNDKVESIDVYITAPTQFTSVSNGVQVGTTTAGTSKTTHFHHGYPIPAYLVAIAVSNYTTYTIQAGTTPNNFPIVNYIYPENLTAAQPEIDGTVPIMDLYEQLFETYPFSTEKYGHCQFGGGGGMEHTTVSFMDGFDRGLIAHELGHQWFGDKVTCGTWKDIWLNEGFATYLSALVIENLDGVDSFIFWKQQVVDFVTELPGGAVYMTDDEATNPNRIFSQRLSYYKGAMVLEMLRWKLGDANFFQGVKNYLADPALAYKYAVTPNLRAHLEAASGVNLTEFFNDWIYNQGYPTYNITAHNIDGGQVQFVVNQIQSHASVNYFEMPVPVRVFGNGGQQMDVVLDNTFNGQVIIKNVPFAVTSIQFDPDRHLISRDNSVSLGNGNFTLMNRVTLSPNPAANTLNVSIPQNVTVKNATFHNSLGQVVLKTGNETSWDISKLASGVHFITLVTDAGTKQLKFIKK
jgi:aminopeptidase N